MRLPLMSDASARADDMPSVCCAAVVSVTAFDGRVFSPLLSPFTVRLYCVSASSPSNVQLLAAPMILSAYLYTSDAESCFPLTATSSMSTLAAPVRFR